MKRTGTETMLTPVMHVNQRVTVFITCIALSGIGTNTTAADTFRQLKGREIASRFTGMEFTDEVHWALVFEKGGRVSSFSMGKASTGSWRIDKDELCISLPPEEPRCYEVWTSGQRVELRSEPAMPEEGILRKPQKRP